MTELERALVALAGELDFPPEPNLVAGVRARLERRRLLFPRRRALALAVALVVVAFGIAMAVPDARSAILRFFHIGAVTVEQVETLAGPDTHVEPVQIGRFGLWIEGGRHVIVWEFERVRVHRLDTRLAGNVLLWLQGERTFRLEGDFSKAEMLKLGRQITR